MLFAAILCLPGLLQELNGTTIVNGGNQPRTVTQAGDLIAV